MSYCCHGKGQGLKAMYNPKKTKDEPVLTCFNAQTFRHPLSNTLLPLEEVVLEKTLMNLM